MSKLEELHKQLNEIRDAMQKLAPGSRAHQKLIEELIVLEAQLTGSGAVAQGNGATSVGENGIGVGGNLDGTLIQGEQNQIFRNSTVILAGEGARILVGEHNTEQNGKPDIQATASYAPTSTNILTFLFTDIEGSTQLWEHHPEAMKTALARHDAILRESIESHKGKVFKTVGDAFYAAFPNARNALRAALTAQRALHTEAWGETVIKVRMALHTGSVEVRNNDYFGPPLNRVARLMSAGHGGQVLLSTTFAELVRASLPPNVELRDMGERSLKDLVRPEHIYQLTVPDLPADFPALKTLEAFRTNLPVQLTSFIGREKEIAAIKNLMAKHRLVTLTGAGGTGKTRLSLQTAADLLDSFPEGVWFVEFAPLSDPALVPQTVLTTLGLREETGRPTLETINSYLQTKKVLLILDNCEHLIEAAAQLAESTLHACTNLCLLVSSRETLGIAGETTYHVRSLSIPHTHLAQSVETVIQYESARLFADRAQAVFSAFVITSTNASAIAQICARLDGIPLAIELAAARVKLLKPEQIAERLDDRFRLLTGGSRTALPRQQTLRAMIDWSYDLLPESESVLLRRLSVFAGGWTLEAAETVCQGPGIEDYDILTPLAQLVNKSLVVVDADDESTETRYRLLETVRQYAREKLSEKGEGKVVRDAHLQYFLGLAERAEPELVGPSVLEWLNQLETEIDNIHIALEWSLQSNALIGLQLINALSEFWKEAFHITVTASTWLSYLLSKPEAKLHTSVRIRALINLVFLSNPPWTQAQATIKEALDISRELNDQSGMALCLCNLAIREEDFIKSQALFLDSLNIYRSLGDKVGIILALDGLSGVWRGIKNVKQTRAYLDECLVLCRETGYTTMMISIMAKLGQLAFWFEENETAHTWLDESWALQKKFGKFGKDGMSIYILQCLAQLTFREGNYKQSYLFYEEIFKFGPYVHDWVRVGLAYTILGQEDTLRARTIFKECLHNFRQIGDTIGIVYTLEGVASMAVIQKQFKQAAQIFAWIDATRISLINPRPPIEQTDINRDIAIIRAHLDQATFAEAQAVGRAMSMDEAIALALESTHD